MEREARTRLRPLKRQAEAAELHERLERQMLEARLELARDGSRTRASELRAAEAQVSEARAARSELDARLQSVIDRRGLAESALAERTERHDALARRAYDARSARERLTLRAEQVSASRETLAGRIARVDLDLSQIGQRPRDDDAEQATEPEASAGEQRITALEQELAELEATRAQELESELGGLVQESGQLTARVSELEQELIAAQEARARADGLVEQAREGSVWSATWEEVRRVIEEGVKRVLRQPDERLRLAAAGEVAARAEHVARGVVEYALKGVRAAEDVREEAESALREAERGCAEAREQQRRTQWLIEQRQAAPQQGPLAVRRVQLQGELEAERRQAAQLARERSERVERMQRLKAQHQSDSALVPLAERLLEALAQAGAQVEESVARLEAELSGDRAAGEQMTAELRACAGEEAGDPDPAARRRRAGYLRRGRGSTAARSARGGGARAAGHRRAAWARGVGGRGGVRRAAG